MDGDCGEEAVEGLKLDLAFGICEAEDAQVDVELQQGVREGLLELVSLGVCRVQRVKSC